MYKITVLNNIFYVDEVRYVHMNPNSGSYVQCSEQDAEAVAICGNLYSLPDKPSVQITVVEQVDEENYNQTIQEAPVALIEPYTEGQHAGEMSKVNELVGNSLVDLQLAMIDLYESSQTSI